MASLLSLIPSIIGGSADLTGSNLTRPASANLVDFQPGSFNGRYIRFGIREHAMTAIVNGIDAHGGLIAFGATFLNFVGYALGALRLSCLSHHGSILVATHDSIGLGEDGPTHQPVELVAGLRAMPNVLVMRPADQTETSACWAIAIEHRKTPSVLCLSRQAAPPLAGSSFDGTFKGAYAVNNVKTPKLVIIGTGTEVALCVSAAAKLADAGISTRIVSMPCTELFDEQSADYHSSLFPVGIPVLSVEAYVDFGWQKYSHYHVGMSSFGASAPDTVLYEKFGITVANVVEKGTKLVAHFNGSAPALRVSL